jgi:drug/metabolite transporter (DMT)-like permease
VSHGVFVGFATCLLTIGPRYISAAEVALLVLLESVLAPLLIWVIAGEHPGKWVIIGGMVVIGALLVSNFIVLLRRRPQ